MTRSTMSDDKCVCGHGHTQAPGRSDHCMDCGCTEFRPAEEAKTDHKDVYERAAKALHEACHLGHLKMTIPVDASRDHDCLIAEGLNAGEEAERLLARALNIADETAGPLPPGTGEEWLTALEQAIFRLRHRAGNAERTARALVATAEMERDTAVTKAEKRAKELSALCADLSMQLGTAQRERDEAQQERQREHDKRVTATGSLELVQESYDHAIGRLNNLALERDSLRARVAELEARTEKGAP